MPARSPRQAPIAGRIAAIERHHGPDDPRLPGLRARLAGCRMSEDLASWAARAAAEPVHHCRRVPAAAPAKLGARPQLGAQPKLGARQGAGARPERPPPEGALGPSGSHRAQQSTSGRPQ